MQIKVIAKSQDISVKYLEQLIAALKSAGIVRSVRGAKGGYLLAKSPERIKLGECFRALEGSMVTVECVSDTDYCSRTADCATRRVWVKVQSAIEDVLDSMTLKDLVEMSKGEKALNYQI